MNFDRRVTQSDVAAEAGVHRATVSLAFKNHPSIPPKTRSRILRIAKKLGYSPDPMLSALAAYRTRMQPHGYQGTLAWLAPEGWSGIPLYREYHAGAAQRAKAHGYDLEIFMLDPPRMTVERIASIMRARNIPGLLLCPQTKAETKLNFPWEQFSVVTFGYSLVKPQLHTVTATQYRGVVKAMHHLQALGYHRIGYAVWEDFDEKTDHNCLAGYVVAEFAGHHGVRIPPYQGIWNHENLTKWIRQNDLDAIVTADSNILRILKEGGVVAPRDIGIACFALPEGHGPLSGVYENSFHVGEVAVDTLVAMIHRGERGIPAIAHRVLVEGTWVQGKSVRAVRSAARRER